MPDKEVNALLVYCSCSPKEAPQLARELVERKLAACVSVVENVVSTYRWQPAETADVRLSAGTGTKNDAAIESAIETTSESLLMIKTLAKHYQALEKTLVELHSYDVPEIIALPIQHGLPAYLRWILAETE